MKRGRGGIKESERRREIKGRVKGGRRDVPPAQLQLLLDPPFFMLRLTFLADTHTYIYTDCRHCMTYSSVGLNNINFYQLVTVV